MWLRLLTDELRREECFQALRLILQGEAGTGPIDRPTDIDAPSKAVPTRQPQLPTSASLRAEALATSGRDMLAAALAPPGYTRPTSRPSLGRAVSSEASNEPPRDVVMCPPELSRRFSLDAFQ